MASRKFAIDTTFRAIDQMSKPIDRMSNSMNRFSGRADRSLSSVNRSLTSARSNVRSVATQLTVVGGAGVGAFGRIAKIGSEFEASMTAAAAKMGGIEAGTDVFKELEKAALDVGSTTEFSATQAAQGLGFLAQAGLSANESITALPAVVNLATGQNMELARAADIATNTMSQFGLASEDSEEQLVNLTRVMDTLTVGANSTNVSVEQMAESLKLTGGVAANAGLSIETTTALIGALGDQGLQGSIAGSSLGAMLTRLQAPAAGAAKLMKELGLDVADSEGNMRDIIDVLDDVVASTENMGEVQQAAVFKELFGVQGARAFNALMGEGTEKLQEQRDALLAANGASQKLADTMRSTTAAGMKSVEAAVEGVTIQLFQLSKDGIDGTIKDINAFIKSISDWIRNNEELAKSILEDVMGGLKALIQIIGILIGLSVALKFATIAVATAQAILRISTFVVNLALLIWKGVMLALPAILGAARIAVLLFNLALAANPIGVIIILIGLLVGAVILLIANWDSVVDFFIGIWDTLKSAFSSGIDGIMVIIKPFLKAGKAIVSIWRKIRGETEEPIDAELNLETNGKPELTAGEGVISPDAGTINAITEQQQSVNGRIVVDTGGAPAEVTEQSGPVALAVADSSRL